MSKTYLHSIRNILPPIGHLYTNFSVCKLVLSININIFSLKKKDYEYYPGRFLVQPFYARRIRGESLACSCSAVASYLVLCQLFSLASCSDLSQAACQALAFVVQNVLSSGQSLLAQAFVPAVLDFDPAF